MRGNVHQPTYRSWQMMKDRCVNPNAQDYAYYGGRGIFISASWFEYDSFLAEMGERPDGLTIERVNSDGWYCKSNCVWASRLDQARNREYCIDLTFNGRTMKTWEWAEELKVKMMTMHFRKWQFNRGVINEQQMFAMNRGA